MSAENRVVITVEILGKEYGYFVQIDEVVLPEFGACVDRVCQELDQDAGEPASAIVLKVAHILNKPCQLATLKKGRDK